VSDDWRITASAYGDEDLHELARRATELAPELDVNAGHSYVFVYGSDDASARTARWALEEAASATGTAADVVVERWNPGRTEWQDPALPVEPAPKLEWWVDIDFDRLRYEVRLHSPDSRSVDELARELLSEGARFLDRGGRVLAVGAYDEEEAQAIADDLRVRAPVGSEIEIRELTAMRRWLAKERVLGNYSPPE
jgi:CO/xanthine dehydrogenase Mo-binding subunit